MVGLPYTIWYTTIIVGIINTSKLNMSRRLFQKQWSKKVCIVPVDHLEVHIVVYIIHF